MNNLKKMTIKLAVVAQILAIMLLTGCAVSVPSTVCHATGDPTNPYEEIKINSVQLKEHSGHSNDIIPAPQGGCPAGPVVIVDGKITICHATGSKTNPYNEITVSVNGLNGHDQHDGDIIPAPKAGCPASPLPTSTAQARITICHASGSETYAYDEMIFNANDLKGHDRHAGDIIPAPKDGCPAIPVATSTAVSGTATSTVNGNNGKITICHATGSKNNPYNEITVSINGLNGHNKHAGDIIPAPQGGCPTTKQ